MGRNFFRCDCLIFIDRFCWLLNCDYFVNVHHSNGFLFGNGNTSIHFYIWARWALFPMKCFSHRKWDFFFLCSCLRHALGTAPSMTILHSTNHRVATNKYTPFSRSLSYLFPAIKWRHNLSFSMAQVGNVKRQLWSMIRFCGCRKLKLDRNLHQKYGAVKKVDNWVVDLSFDVQNVSLGESVRSTALWMLIKYANSVHP